MFKAIRIVQPNQITLANLKLPRLQADEVLIKVMASGICGTDIHILRGDYIAQYPIIPGHEFSGVIEKIGESVSRFEIGSKVAVEPNISCDNCYNCLNNRQNYCKNWQAIGVTKSGGMAQFVVVPEKSVFNIDKLQYEYAAFMEPLSCVLHGLKKVKINPGDRVVVFGAGPIGILFLQMVRLQGAVHVSVLENITSRAALAEHYGADQIFQNISDFDKDNFDVVIDATGVISLMEQTIDLVRTGGGVLLFGVPPAEQKLKLEGMKLFQKGLTIFSSFTSVRNSYQAIALLEAGKIDVSDLISHRLPLSEFERGIKLIEKGDDDVKKVMILPQQ
ncbi:MAG: zinc-dependent alcohol dehydrogenase family protein [Bacteroidetes bacterium]|nr:zinc-dependent alcohol dehydrogenase family protein [Bacteroidota bacterium]